MWVHCVLGCGAKAGVTRNASCILSMWACECVGLFWWAWPSKAQDSDRSATHNKRVEAQGVQIETTLECADSPGHSDSQSCLDVWNTWVSLPVAGE